MIAIQLHNTVYKRHYLKPQNSSKVEDVVIKLERTNKRYAQMLREIEFINQSQQKLGHVDFCFLELLKKGTSVMM